MTLRGAKRNTGGKTDPLVNRPRKIPRVLALDRTQASHNTYIIVKLHS